MMDSNNIHFTIQRSGTVDAASSERTRPGAFARPVFPSKTSSESSNNVLSIEKTTWQLSPEVQKLIESLTTPSSTASVRLDPESNRLIVEVRNAKTGELIREIPPEDLLHQAAKKGIHVDPMLDELI